MEKSTKRRQHSDEFKMEAVELANRIGILKASKELGVHQTCVRTWKKKFQGPNSSTNSSPSKKSTSDLEREIKRLTKENGYLREINKVLKKSTAIFSSDHMGGLK